MATTAEAKYLLNEFRRKMDFREYQRGLEAMQYIPNLLKNWNPIAMGILGEYADQLRAAVEYEKRHKHVSTDAIDFARKHSARICELARNELRQSTGLEQANFFESAMKLRAAIPGDLEPMLPAIDGSQTFRSAVKDVLKKLPRDVRERLSKVCFVELNKQATRGIFSCCATEVIGTAPDMPRKTLESVLIHEIAHAWLNHSGGTEQNERAANEQVKIWKNGNYWFLNK
jgi:hypothetical protein